MKRRQERGEEEKKMGTKEREREKKKQMRKQWRKKEERKEKRRGIEEGEEGREENRECGAKDAPPLPRDAFPSQKLWNNMTPIKGRLGKNTTPTRRDPENLIQRRQRNPIEDSRTSSIPPMRTPSTRCEMQNLKKHRIQRQHNHHL